MNILIVVITLFFIYSEALSQNFFPLEVGNKWQYQVRYYSSNYGGGTTYAQLNVVSDSILSGIPCFKLSGATYIFDTFQGSNFLFNYDTSQQKLLVKLPEDDTLRLAVDFNLPADSQFVSYINKYPSNYVSNGISVDTVFNQEITTYQIMYETSVKKRLYRFGDQFGIVYYYHWWADGVRWGYSKYNLCSAILDTLIFNPLTLNITSLFPLENRSIDDFPFVLYGSFNATITGLIDSFYVDLMHTRFGTTINFFKLDIIDGAVEVPIYPEQLNIGDKLKVRATATDESIFNNISYYPDTGYAIIHLLPSISNIITQNIIYSNNLFTNYPNPFNPATSLQYAISSRQIVTLKVYDVLGREIATLVDEEKPAGEYKVEFDGTDLPSRIYFYRIKAGDYIETKKMVLIK